MNFTLLPNATTSRIFILSAFLLCSTQVWAPPGRAPAPVHIARPEPPIRTEPARSRTGAERGIDEFGKDWRKLNDEENVLVRKPGPDRADTSIRRSWERITAALGPPTSDLASAYVALIVLAEGQAVLTTNYQNQDKPGVPVFALLHADLRDSTKLATTVQELLGTPTQATDVQLKIVLTDQVDSNQFRLVFDKEAQSFNINTSLFRNAELFVKDSPQVFSLERIDRESPPPRWAARLNKCCVYTGVPPDFSGWGRLGNLPFNRPDASLVSLFPDTQTEAVLKAAKGKNFITHPDQLKSDPVAGIRQAFATGDPRSPVILIGHVEGSAFKVEGADGYEIPFSTIVTIAKEAGRPVIFLGCYTANHFASLKGTIGIRDYPIGTLNKLYPREIAPKVIEALNSSDSMQEFITKLSDENLYLWISNNFLRNVDAGAAQTFRAPIFKQATDKSRTIVGFLFAYLPCKAFGGC